MTLDVARSVIDALVCEATRAAPKEACGLLLGSAERIEAAVPARNVHPTPQTHFEIDPAALIAAHKAERSGGPAITGYWHSHPTGSTAPSATDQASASGDGKVWAIVTRGEVAFWRDAPGGFEALSTQVVAG
ncbi:MAG: M67 family metallopeptidase [Novosphingobium sp.]|nr:M67 family metallopeptidase [Novosphingobium sp.]